jgi:serine/threonine protein kinase
MFGKLPFPGPDIDEQVTNDQPDFPEKVSDEFKACVTAMLTKDPNERPTIDELIADYPWIQV